MSKARLIDPDQVRRWMEESFQVDPSSGILIWAKPPSNHPRLLGVEAGHPRVGRGWKRYVVIKMDGCALLRSWLVFLWVTRRWPADCLDHANGDSTDDRFENLREATPMQNAWNHKTRAKESPLPMGVRASREGTRFYARLCVNKRHLSLGSFSSPEAASAAYVAARKEHFHEFA